MPGNCKLWCLYCSNCSWNFPSESCHLNCDKGPCLALPYSMWNIDLESEQLCIETKQILNKDNQCGGHSDCEACTNDGCRWINTCENQNTSSDCEGCYASSCSGTCNEMNSCSESNVCSADGCASCLDKGCSWILDYRKSCFYTCPSDDYIVLRKTT